MDADDLPHRPPDLSVADATAQRLSAPVVAVEAILTDVCWFEGLDPATSWALIWLGERGRAASPVAEIAVRIGYRVGRVLLGAQEHPAIDEPERCDSHAEQLYRATTSLSTSRFFGDLSPELYRTLSMCAIVLTSRPTVDRVGEHPETTPHRDPDDLEAEAAALAVVLNGFVLALLELQLSRRG